MEIINLGRDEKITQPGFYRMPLWQHHSQPCDGVSVTSSVLRTMRKGTPADVWAFHRLNPDRMEQPDRPAWKLGSAIAAFIEGGEDQLRGEFYVLPAKKPNRPNEKQLIAFKEGRATQAAMEAISFWERVEADPRPKITEADVDRIKALGEVLARDPVAATMLGGEPEITMAWKDPKTGIWCLSRPDNMTFDGTGVDYKSISIMDAYIQPYHIDRRITDHLLFMQMGWADEAFEQITGERMGALGFVFQLTTPPFHVIPRALDDEEVGIGRWMNRQSLDRFAECLASDNWPGPGEHVGAYHMPAKLRERILEEMNTEGEAP